MTKPVRIAALLLVLALVAIAAPAAGWAAPAQAASFADVPDSSPYRLQIEVLSQLGVISGFSDGSFRQGAQVTRQQFAKMVVLAMRVPVSEQNICSFVDVPVSGPDGLFPDNYVAAAAGKGITTGTRAAVAGRGPLFSPGAPISLAQLVTMAGRAAGVPLETPPDSYESGWGEFNAVHGPAARVAQYNGLLRELPLASMNPWSRATRGEAAAILFNLMGADPKGLNGRFLGTSGDLVRYFRMKNQTGELFSIPLEQLANLYVQYGRRFGIRADMAWAQMIHETGFGHYGGSVKPEQNNMAGIGATGGGVPGNSFATAELGVIAQYAHLAWYIYPDHLHDPYCCSSLNPNVPGDPRHFVIDGKVHRGNVRIVLDLAAKWAVGAEYGDALLRIDQGIPVTHGW